MKEFSLLGFASFATGMISSIEHAKHAALTKAAKIVQKEARSVLGTDGYDWPALSPYTHKTMPGMLLETAEMKNSIQYNVDHNGHEAHVGSNLDKAVWQELGTMKGGKQAIPPRTFLMGAAKAKRHEIGKVIGMHIVKMIKP